VDTNLQLIQLHNITCS